LRLLTISRYAIVVSVVGTLPGGVGNITGWIASAQHLKPDNAMRSYDQLEGPQLRALAEYLESLK
jgi:cytochrome c oxidase subunit 2